MSPVATALATLMALPIVKLAPHATPVDDMVRLRAALGASCPRLLIKRDDLLSFAMGGNKVRKMQAVAAEALAGGADMLITCGGVQSNHARVTAATGAVLGLSVVLVLNGEPQSQPTANALLDALFGADMRYVRSRDERGPMMEQIAGELRAAGRRPWIVPLGASTATGAMGFAKGVAELSAAGVRPDVIVTSSSSGGTQAGIIAGAALIGLKTTVIGISADDPADSIRAVVRRLLTDVATRLAARADSVGADAEVHVDDTFVGGGYGVSTDASREATELVARCEGIVLDPTYSSKAMAALIARVRRGEFQSDQTILFWHTGGQVALFR